MTIRKKCVALASFALAMTGSGIGTATGQNGDVREKPPLYTFVSNWAIPRAHWADMDKQAGLNAKVFEKAMAGGQLVGYGHDVALVHQADGETHDTFWSGMSMAGLLSVLEEIRASGTATAPVLGTATKHSDSLFVSRFYNWKSGSLKGAYTHGALYRLKQDAPNDAVATLSKTFIVPLLEKLLSNGTISEYEVDVEAIHTQNPATFWVFYITPTADGVDKVTAALGEALGANPLAGPAFGSMVDFSVHQDDLARSEVTYK